MKLSWNWLKDYTPVSKPAQLVAERLTMAGIEVKRVEKVGDDFLLETEITSNRPDWLSHIGVAREIAALFRVPLKLPRLSKRKPDASAQTFSVQTLEFDLCPFYSAAVLEGVGAAKTPDWMKRRLELCGLRLIQFVVDVTNYVLLECGQPLHAFDLTKLNGSRIVARRAQKNERFLAINGVAYELSTDDCVIADAKGPAALGGIMGGLESSMAESSRHILIESAFFKSSAIRKSSRRLKLASESSYRFERGVDPLGVDFARERTIDLITQYARVSKVGRPLRSGKLPLRPKQIRCSMDQIGQILGLSISPSETKSIISKLGATVRSAGSNSIRCEAPSFRLDLNEPVDLIEEVARIHGYEKIPETMPSMYPIEQLSSPTLKLSEEIRALLRGFGLNEAVTFSIIDPDVLEKIGSRKEEWVRILNPRNRQLTLMRPTFILNFLQVIKQNLNVGAKSIRIFEIGNCYWRQDNGLPREERTAAFAFCGETPLHWLNHPRPYGFYDLKGLVEVLSGRLRRPVEFRTTTIPDSLVPGEALEVVCGGVSLGCIGMVAEKSSRLLDIEKPIYFGEISVAKLAQIPMEPVRPKEVPKYPFIERDLSVIVDRDVTSQDIADRIKTAGGGLVRGVNVFDAYQGNRLPADKKSLAFRICYQSLDKTLQAEEVNQLHFSVVDELAKRFGAMLPPKSKEA